MSEAQIVWEGMVEILGGQIMGCLDAVLTYAGSP